MISANLPTINASRLWERLEQLGNIGARAEGGICRLALSDADKQGRDLVVRWMRELDLDISIDPIGNVVGVMAGQTDGKCVMVGSHIDTVSTAGIFDGNLGVLAGLEVIATCQDNGIRPYHPLAVAFFTNEEGSRFAPDMMGSAVFNGSLPLETALNTVGIDGARVEDELKAIDYAGSTRHEPTSQWVKAFVELHVEQGPVLDLEQLDIGIVEGVQGISWQKINIKGQSNHAGTTPMQYRRDAGLMAAQATAFAHQLTQQLGAGQLATVGAIVLHPNLINVIPHSAEFTLDLRNCDEATLKSAEKEFAQFMDEQCQAALLTYSSKHLARFAPVQFDPELIDKVEAISQQFGYSSRRMFSGAGHDAQMFAPNCPTTMIFVPSIKGISHNPEEYTLCEQIEKGANVLFNLVIDLASE